MQVKFRVEATNLQTKLDIAMASARAAAQRAVVKAVESLREEVARTIESVYPMEEEIRTLMQGIITEGVGATHGSFGQVGTDEGGRLDRGAFMPLSRIIRSCPVITANESVGYTIGAGAPMMPKPVTITGGNYVSAQCCQADYINELAKFTYYRASGQAYKADPFHGKYIQSVEDGGYWRVTPRPDNRARMLLPEPGVRAKEMVKMLPARQPFASTIYRERGRVINEVMMAIKDSVSFRDITRYHGGGGGATGTGTAVIGNATRTVVT